jgi:hypothetical protein
MAYRYLLLRPLQAATGPKRSYLSSDSKWFIRSTGERGLLEPGRGRDGEMCATARI